MNRDHDKRTVATTLGAAALMIVLAASFSAGGWKSFCDAFGFWDETLLMGTACGAILGAAGFWLLAQRGIYTGLSLAAAAVFGLQITSAAFAAALGILPPHGVVFASATIIGTGAYLGAIRWLEKPFGRDAAAASVYVAATAGTILLSNWLPQGHHEMENLIFGNSVSLLPEEIAPALVCLGILTTLTLTGARTWLLIIFDRTFLSVRNGNITRSALALNVCTAVSLVCGAKLIGMLAAFAILLCAPLIATDQCRSGIKTLCLCAIIGAILFPTGFVLSFFLDAPTGACIAATGCLLTATTRLLTRNRKTP